MDGIEISVIVPVYNIEDYLPHCVQSLLDQSFSDFELILVNDGSPDGCPKICDDFSKKDSRIVVIHKENGGLLSARKAGLAMARGKYISYVDGDDWVDKYYLDVLYKLATTNSSDLVITGHFREFGGKIEIIKPKKAKTYHEEEIKSSILPNAIYNGNFCEHGVSTYVWNKLFKKTLLNKILFDVPNEIVMGEDAAITYAYLSVSKILTISRIPLYYYRQRHDSIVKSIESPKVEYYRLGLLTNFLKSKLCHVLNEKNLDKQLTFYLYSQVLVRSGGLITDKNGHTIFNPFLNVGARSKVVVYSSGSFGQHILSTNTNFFEIIKWIDVDFHKLSIDGKQVEPISSINNNEFDFLIIATIDPTNYEAIQEELGLMGIDKNKIAKINTNKTEIDNLLMNLGFNKDFTFNDKK